jgi:predicted transcriptional regulator
MAVGKRYPRANPVVPEEIRLLSQLCGISAMSADRSLTLEEISAWTGTERERAMENLLKLIRAGYVRTYSLRGEMRYYITENGIRKALSAFS